MRDFVDPMPMRLVKPRGPVEITTADADAATRASWPGRSGAALHLVQPMAAEAATEVDETPAADEYDIPRSQADRRLAARFWNGYLLSLALLGAAAGVWRFWPV